ncbi:hypothetical protein V2O64_21360 [Verrucomicrobiaceae bacterium 227]
MKLHRFIPLLLGSLLHAQEPVAPGPMPATAVPEKIEARSESVDHRIIIEAPAPKAKAPLFYTTEVSANVVFSPGKIVETASVNMQVVQGEAHKLAIEVSGTAPIVRIEGEGVKAWSVRQQGEQRFVDLLPRDPKDRFLQATIVLERTQFKLPTNQAVTTYGPASASGYAATYTVKSIEGLAHKLINAEGVQTLKSEEGVDRMTSNKSASVIAELSLAASQPLPIEFRDARLVGKIDPNDGSASFRLIGTAHVASTSPISLKVLRGRAAPTAPLATADYRLKLGENGYEIEFTKPGVYPIDLPFVTPLQTAGEWKNVNFSVASGAVVPIELSGINESAVFNPALPVIPATGKEGMRGFLPASGNCQFAWQPERKTSDGKLFFTSEAMGEISVGAGLLRQMTSITVKTLQGSLDTLNMKLDGSGEVLAVEGENVLSWKVSDERMLEIVLSRPVTKEATFLIRAQSALDALPVQTEALRLTPEGAVRHSGYFRVYNSGAVRIEVMKTVGLTQLSPDQYPQAAALPANLRQVFFYRYPAATRSFTISAERVKPEINVSQTLSYELTETDRVLRADIELDVREAPIREWQLLGPADYSVVAVTGADVADYVASAPEKGGRRIKVIFTKEISGRRLVQFHLERNEPAKAGNWVLPVLSYPGSQVVRGELGVSVAPGFRVNPGANEGLAEMPLIQLVKRGPNLQQAFRIRGESWKATMTIEALSQNVQADVFHLYSLKEGVAYVSVLVNYFVTGAPVNQWELTLPAGIEHLSVDGRDVRDSRVDETALVVPLHRPVMGTYQLLVTYEQNVGEDGVLTLGELTPVSVQGERGFIQVVSPGQVELSDTLTSDHLVKLDPLELPAEYRLMSHAPSLAAWQYNNRPLSLKTGISWFSRGETARQVVEFADFSSRIARDGGVVTLSTFDVRTRGSRMLELDVPEGLLISEVTVDGQQMTVRKADDQRLVPLPDTVGPNQPVRVVIRSSSAGSGDLIRVVAPTVTGTTQLMTRWHLEPDTGYALKPVNSGGLNLLTKFSSDNGMTWIEKFALPTFALIVVAWVFGTCVMRIDAGVSIVGAAIVLFAAAGAFFLSSKGFEQELQLPSALDYSVPVSAPDEILSVTVEHVEVDAVNLSSFGMLLILVAVILGYFAWNLAPQRTLLAGLAGVALSFGLLLQVGGAGVFFLLFGLLILCLWWKGVRASMEGWKEMFRREDPEIDLDEDDDLDELETGGKSGVTAMILIGFMALFGGQQVKAADLASDSLTETWSVRERRLEAQASMQVTAKEGERFLLLSSPATLTEFAGEKVRVITENGNYIAIATEDGTHQVTFTYQAPAVNVAKGVAVLTGPSAVRSLTVNYEAAGWSIDSPSAVKKKTLEGKGSSAQLWLAPEANSLVVMSPKARDVAAEATQFYSEVDDLFIPGPGVVDGVHRVRIRPAQGQVKQLSLTVPEGFTVSDVSSKLVGPWRFDPEQGLLTIELAPFQSKPFQIFIETQRALDELPAEVVVAPMRVGGSAGEVGMVALAFGKEAQLDRDEPQGMSLVNLTDFDQSLLPVDRENRPTATLQKVYRYSKGEASLKLKVAPVSPEVRVTSSQRLSFGDERTVLAAELTTTITRAGVFRLSFPLPKGFEVESLTGNALNHWVEVAEKGQTMVVMNLNGKTIGQQVFSLVLAGTTPAMPIAKWAVPKVELQEADRQSGQLIVIPGRGIQLRVEQRKDLSALDPRSVGGNQQGSLAFRLLQKSWLLSLAVDQLDPSIAAQVLTDVELRDGRSMTRLDLRVQIENASVRDLEIQLPGISETDAQTIRASGGEVRDIVNIEGDRWQIRFKRRVIGAVTVRIEYEENQSSAVIHNCILPGARQQESFLALRPGARLELVIEKAQGWSSTDWVALPKSLFQLDRSGVPAGFFRSTRPGGSVEIKLKRHAVLTGSKIRVKQGQLLTVVSPYGELMNQADLELEALQRGSMTLTLPPNSRLFGVFVNEESALVVQDGDSYRFHVTGDAGGRDAKLRFTYATTQRVGSLEKLDLTAFKIGEPLENVTWVISVPEGYALSDSDGDLDLESNYDGGLMTRKKYLQLVALRNSSKEEGALGRLGKVSGYLKAGEQDKAAKTLEQVYNGSNLDAASNEDARVKLENLVTQQAVVGLNTRRQRLWLDNRGVALDSPQNDQIEVAANANPVFAGNLNFGKDDFQNVIQGNGVEVNRMLNTIASKWIRHQRITEPVSQMLDPVISPSGKSVVFTREIQVSGDQALGLELDIEAESQATSWGGRIAVLLLVAVAIGFGVRRSQLA